MVNQSQKIITLLMNAQEKAIKIKPKVGGFPYLAEVFKQAGIIKNHWNLPSCQSTFITNEGSVVFQGSPLITGYAPIPTFDRDALIKAIRIDQNGDSLFPEFLLAIWKAGVTSYNVDFLKRVVTYYGFQGESYEEKYQEVSIS